MTTQSGETVDNDEEEQQQQHPRRRELRRMPSYPYYNMVHLSIANGQRPPSPPPPTQPPPPSYESLEHQ